jgi:hypothetical protein
MIYELFTNMHECLEVCTKAYSCFKTGLWLTKTDLTKLRISKSGCFELELMKKYRVKPMTGMCFLISSSSSSSSPGTNVILHHFSDFLHWIYSPCIIVISIILVNGYPDSFTYTS